MGSFQLFCTNCGAALRRTAKFCPRCGTPVEEAPTVPGLPAAAPPPPTWAAPPPSSPGRGSAAAARPAQARQPAARPPAQARPRRWRSVTWLVTGVALLLLCCLGVILGASAVWAWPQIQEALGLASPTPVAGPSASPPPTSTATATLIPPPTYLPPTQPALNVASYNHIHFGYSPALAANVIPETVPAQNPGQGMPFDVAPEHSRFSLEGYPLFPQAFHRPRISVYPLEAYIALRPEAAGISDQLAGLLAQRPANLPPDQKLPYLPGFPAEQLYHANLAYVDFQGGAGLRYLAQFGQDTFPASNRDLAYIFQGLTDDRRYLISAIMPVSSSVLPDPDTIPVDESFRANYGNYTRTIQALLGSQPPTSFTPSLFLLDALFQSLAIQ